MDDAEFTGLERRKQNLLYTALICSRREKIYRQNRQRAEEELRGIKMMEELEKINEQ